MADIAKHKAKLSAILGDSSRCVCCARVQVSVMCSLCLSLRQGCFPNPSPAIHCPDSVAAGIGDQVSSQDDNSLNDTDINNSFPVINERFQCVFGSSLLQSEGDCYDDT